MAQQLPALWQMTEREQAIALTYYESGVSAGLKVADDHYWGPPLPYDVARAHLIDMATHAVSAPRTSSVKPAVATSKEHHTMELTVTPERIPGEGRFDIYRDAEGRERGSLQFREDRCIAAVTTYGPDGARTGFETVGSWPISARAEADRALREAIASPTPATSSSPDEAVTIYTTPGCPGCELTKNALSKAGVTFRVVDLSQDLQAREALVSEGFTAAPIVETPDGSRTAGFRPDRIKAIIAAQQPQNRQGTPSVTPKPPHQRPNTNAQRKRPTL